MNKINKSFIMIVMPFLFMSSHAFSYTNSSYRYFNDPRFDLEKFLNMPGDNIPVEKLVAINAKEKDATVKISIYHTKTERLDSIAAGTFISSTGHILTSYHVIMDSLNDKYHPHFTLSDGTIIKDYEDIECNKVGGDICLLKIKTNPKYYFNPNEILLDTPAKGEKLYMIGFPDGIGWDVRAGISLGVVVPLRKTFSKRLKITVPVRPGFSGGPVFDSSSRLVCLASNRYYKEEIVNGKVLPSKDSLEHFCVNSEIIRPILLRAGLLK